MPQAQVTTGTDERWVSIGEVAAMAHVAVGTVYRKIREGVLPAFNITGRTRLRRSDVLAFMAPKPIVPRSRRNRAR